MRLKNRYFVFLIFILFSCIDQREDQLDELDNLDSDKIKSMKVVVKDSPHHRRAIYMIDNKSSLKRFFYTLKQTKLEYIKGQRLLVNEMYECQILFADDSELCFEIAYSKKYMSGMIMSYSKCNEGWYFGSHRNHEALLEIRFLLRNAELLEVLPDYPT